MNTHLLIPLLVLGTPALAQEQKAQERTYRVLAPEHLNVKATELYLFNGKHSDAIQQMSKSLSPVQSLPDGDVTLHLALDQIDGGGNLPEETASAQIPSNITDALLLILNEPDNESIPLKVVVIDIGDQQLKAGETMWVNLTKNTIHATLGDQNLAIDPESRRISKPPASKSGYYKASFDYLPPKSKTAKLVMTKSWWHDHTSKSFGFVIENDRSALPTIFTVRDRR